MDAWTDYHNEMFHVRRSVKYHEYRQRFFENVLNVSLFLAFTSGPALVLLAITVGNGSSDDPHLIRYIPAILTSVFTGAALVAKAGTKANLHSELKVEFLRLRQDMEIGRAEAQGSGQAVAEWTARRLGIETREPPINRVVGGLCHNEVLQSMGEKDDTQYVRVLVWHRLVGPFTRYFDNGLRQYKKGERRSVWV